MKHSNVRYPVIVAIALTLLLVAGCGGGAQPVSWAGITVDGDNLYVAYMDRVIALSGEGYPLTANSTPDADPAWSPDASRLALAAVTEDGGDDYELYISTVGGHISGPLTDNAYDDLSPTWSPDGRYLAYVAYPDDGDDAEIFVLPLDGDEPGEPIRVTDNDFEDILPAWSPVEGEMLLALVSDRDGDLDVYLMDISCVETDEGCTTDPEVELLTRNAAADTDPSWSPDGSRIAFASDRGEGGDFDIWVMNRDGRDREAITEDREADDVHPTWAGDGAYLAFASNRDGDFNIYRVNADGSNILRITDSTADDTSPAWEPSAEYRSTSRIAFVSDRDGDAEVIIIDIEVTTGVPIWAFPPESNNAQFYAPPAVTPDRVYVGGFDTKVYALERGTGELIWTNEDPVDRIIAGVAVGDGLVYVGIANRGVMAIDEESGEQVWYFDTGHGIWATPLLVGDTLYVSSLDHHVYALNAPTGEPIWESERLSGAVPDSPAYDPERGRLYIGTLDRKVHALDVETGEVVGTFDAADWVWGSPVLAGDEIYFADLSGHAYALDVDSFEPIWEAEVADDKGIRGSPLVTETLVVLAAQDGNVYARHRSDGSPAWQADGGGRLITSPVLFGDSIIVSPIGADYVLVAFDRNGSRQWVFPPPGGD